MDGLLERKQRERDGRSAQRGLRKSLATALSELVVTHKSLAVLVFSP